MKPLKWTQSKGAARTATAVLALTALAPVLILLAKGIVALAADVRVSGDPAVTELYTLRATAGDQWLGPYSRFGFHHPGPLIFYAFAPFYAVLGESYASLCIGAIVINLVSLAGIAVIVRRLAGPPRAYWALAALAAYITYLQPGLLVSAWNPDVAVAPLALALVALTAAMAGSTACLPVAAMAGSLAVQSHLTAAAPVAVAGLLTTALLVLRRHRPRVEEAREGRTFVRHLVMTAVVLAAAWAPCVIEQIRDNPGNVTLIFRYLGERHEGQTLGTAVPAVAAQASGFVLSALGVSGQALPVGALSHAAAALSCLLVALLLVGAWRGWARGDSFVVAGCVTSMLLLLVAGAVTLRISGPLWPYLTRWVSAVGLLGWLLVAAAFTRREWDVARVSRVQAAAFALLIFGLAVGGIRNAARFGSVRTYIASAWPDRLSKQTTDALAARSVRRPHLRILSNRSWEQAAGIVLQCEKAGTTITVDSDWLFMFGGSCRLREPDDGAVLVAPSALAESLAREPGIEVLATGGGDTALLGACGSTAVGILNMGTLGAEAYLRGGFSGPENEQGGAFRWSDGPVSWLRLPASLGSPHQLRFMACPVESPGVPETVTVEMNGHRLEALAMRRGWAPYSVPVPDAVLRAQNLVVLRYSLVRSPHEIGRGEDRRHLAVRFRWISLGGESADSARLPDSGESRLKAGGSTLIAAGSQGR